MGIFLKAKLWTAFSRSSFLRSHVYDFKNKIIYNSGQNFVIVLSFGKLTTLTENGLASDKYQNVARMARLKNNLDGMVLKLGS